MYEVRSFSSAEELFEELRKNKEQSDSLIVPWQREVKPGDRVIRYEEGLVIYGRITDPVEEDRKYYSDPDHDPEFLSIRAYFTSPSWTGSYRYGWFYSAMCPEGEPGSIPLATIAKVIDEATFEAAKEAGWPSTPPAGRA